jgi:tRNA dimethylallyltransferase
MWISHFTFTVFATAGERAELRRRIDARLEQRLEAGLVAEVEGLLKKGLSPGRLKLMGMEYREITAHLEGERDYAGMVENLRHEIHLLAKRQETYFRGMRARGLTVHDLPLGAGAEAVLALWKRLGGGHG